MSHSDYATDCCPHEDASAQRTWILSLLFTAEYLVPITLPGTQKAIDADLLKGRKEGDKASREGLLEEVGL